MQVEPPKPIIQQVMEACALLEAAYGTPRLGNPIDPVDDLIFIILSNKTSSSIAQALFTRLRLHGTWSELMSQNEQQLSELIKEGGFAQIRSKFILGSLRKIQDDFGSIDLSPLSEQSEQQAFEYLTSLPGVSNKVAKCVMLYTLGFKVLPVDAHVFRVAKRIGWTTKNRADLSHKQLEFLIPADLRYSFHVNAVAHGRAICRPHQPRCSECPLKSFCTFGSHRST